MNQIKLNGLWFFKKKKLPILQGLYFFKKVRYLLKSKKYV